MVTNNLWTLGQQYFLYEKMAKEDDAAALQRREEQKALAPRVGVKPSNSKKSRPSASGTAGVSGPTAEVGTATVDDGEVHGRGSGPADAPGSAPRPGQRPQAPGGQRTRPAQKGSGSRPQNKKKKKKR